MGIYRLSDGVVKADARFGLGSIRVPRVGRCVLAATDFYGKFAKAGHLRQHPGRARSPEIPLPRWIGFSEDDGPVNRRRPDAMRPRIAFVPRVNGVWVFALLLALAPISISGAAKSRSPMHLPGYKAVRVHYGPMNKMIMSVRINGQPAKLLVDTGSNQLILNAEEAASFGVKPSQRGLGYIRFTQINGRDFPVGFAQNVTAGSMNFGSRLVTLDNSIHSDAGKTHVDGVLGLDILLRRKAIINCRTKLIFFNVDQSRRMNLGAIAASEKFTRVPIQREENGALTVLCSIRGQPARLLIDTGAFVTTLHQAFVRSLGITWEPTRISAQFGRGAAKQISAAKINDLKIGAFKVPPQKFGVAQLPKFALQHGSNRIAGILGMDTLYIRHAIIDLDGLNLFLK